MKQITLAQCIAQVESSGNKLAQRFEPRIYASTGYKTQTEICQYAVCGYIDNTSAAVIAATSWGMYQIMGYNLYDFGYKGTIFQFQGSETLQGQYLIAFFRKNIPLVNPMKIFNQLTDEEIMQVGDIYNGNGPAYSASLKQAFQTLSSQ